MRFEINAEGVTLPVELHLYAESRVGLSVHRAAGRLSFVGVRLRRDASHLSDSPIDCQLEAWIRGLGIVTARHADPDVYVAIDRAAALLEQAVTRKLQAIVAMEAQEQEEQYVPLTSDAYL